MFSTYFSDLTFVAAARVEGRSDAEIKADTGGWVLCTPTQTIQRARG